MTDLVAKHWPHLAELVSTLEALNGSTVEVTGAMTKVSQETVDAVHEGLLKKQRSGSLGLND